MRNMLDNQNTNNTQTQGSSDPETTSNSTKNSGRTYTQEQVDDLLNTTNQKYKNAQATIQQLTEMNSQYSSQIDEYKTKDIFNQFNVKADQVDNVKAIMKANNVDAKSLEKFLKNDNMKIFMEEIIPESADAYRATIKNNQTSSSNVSPNTSINGNLQPNPQGKVQPTTPTQNDVYGQFLKNQNKF